MFFEPSIFSLSVEYQAISQVFPFCPCCAIFRHIKLKERRRRIPRAVANLKPFPFPEMVSALVLFFSSFFFLTFLVHSSQPVLNNSAVRVNVGVILDLESWVGKMGNHSISIALDDFYSAHNHSKRLNIHTARPGKGVVDAASAVDLLNNTQVEAIIGPQKSGDAGFIASLGDTTRVPILSFSATSPSLSSFKTPYFVRTAESDGAQVDAIVAIIQAFGWHEVVPVYVDSDFGRGVIPFLTDALQKIGVTIPYRSPLPPSANDEAISKELDHLASNRTRVFVVHLPSVLGAQFFDCVNKKGMMSEGFVWIVTNSLGNLLGSLDVSVIEALVGVVGVRTYIPPTKALRDFTRSWKAGWFKSMTGAPAPEIDVFCLWAYDTASALARAVERVEGAGSSKFIKLPMNPSDATTNSVNLSSALGVSPWGPDLLRAIRETRFKGLSGEFRLVDGQLQPKTFQVINVVKRGVIKEIGYWNLDTGLMRNLDSSGKYVGSNGGGLEEVLWPGGSTTVPKGWMIKKLKIGVPVKISYTEFVGVVRHPGTNHVDVQGYAVDVFKAVLENLSYSLSYEFFPFENASGLMNGTYDDLIYQVYLGVSIFLTSLSLVKNYDGVVGDITITANRSNFVDFTLPYSESGVTMLVPLKPHRSNAWVFLKPLTAGLWLTTGAFFVFTGLVVWMLERAKGRSEFQGPIGEQMGLVFNFIFFTMVFAHKERLGSNLSRLVIIVWVFVVLILTTSYTANLTSMLTIQQLEPSFTDLQTLFRNGDYVGYRQGSFIKDLLLQLNVPESRIRSYNRPEEFPEAFSKGSSNGGVAVIFDATLKNKIFLGRHGHDKYTTVGPTYKNGGFAFVFPRKSPLVPDISRAILTVREGNRILEIEKKWMITNQTVSPDNGNQPNSLSLSSFWGLFLITGTSSLGALLIYTFQFLRQYHAGRSNQAPSSFTDESRNDNNKYLWQKMWDILQHFDEKDYDSLTFRHMVRALEREQGCEHRSYRDNPVSIISDASLTYGGAGYSTDPDDSTHAHPLGNEIAPEN